MPVGSSSVANAANTSTGLALYTVADASNGYGNSVGGSGVVNQYSGGGPVTAYFIQMEDWTPLNPGNIELENGSGFIQLQQ